VDIARSVGVSNSTVSRALHGHEDISPETRQAVLDMAAQLDYQPNQLAYNLVKSRTHTIGMIVPEFHNRFFPNVIMGAHQILTAEGYNLTIMQSNESRGFQHQSHACQQDRRVTHLPYTGNQ
jgi:DNA-binding LacI/PurR family transcriptional regulator